MTLPAREAATAFADVVYADQQWVDAEFDALISASFSEPPAPPRVPRRPGIPSRPPGCRFRSRPMQPPRPPGQNPAGSVRPRRTPSPSYRATNRAATRVTTRQHRAERKEDRTKTPSS